VVFGTRPEAIKLAPVILALQADPRFEPVVVTTGQHPELLAPILETFAIAVDHDLRIGRHGQTLASITCAALGGLDDLVARLHPDVVVVQGDTTSTFTGALAGFYHRVPVVHVEAGLRTGDRYSPFPEEVNRRLTTALTTLHLAPTTGNVANLLAEGVARDAVVCTGNTVIDALRHVVALPLVRPAPVVAEVEASSARVVLVTVHRRESWGEPLTAVARALGRLARAHPEVLVVLPAHPNPRVRASLTPALDGITNVRVVEPLDYRSFAALLARAVLVLTDSGGIQEEAPSLGVPVLVLREVTERPEAVAAGTVEIVGTDEARIVERATDLLDPEGAWAGRSRPVNPYGDGLAVPRTVAAIAHLLGDGPPAHQFLATSP
jgi:UDP-N-acetylglucosamine 2-epimerase (non-hydrolysing)